jgi:hypothetical protein
VKEDRQNALFLRQYPHRPTSLSQGGCRIIRRHFDQHPQTFVGVDFTDKPLDITRSPEASLDANTFPCEQVNDFRPASANDRPASRACLMNSSASGLSVRSFNLTIPGTPMV